MDGECVVVVRNACDVGNEMELCMESMASRVARCRCLDDTMMYWFGFANNVAADVKYLCLMKVLQQRSVRR